MEQKAFSVTYKTSPRKTETAIRFARSFDAATESAVRVLEVEQGYKISSVEEIRDPRE